MLPKKYLSTLAHINAAYLCNNLVFGRNQRRQDAQDIAIKLFFCVGT